MKRKLYVLYGSTKGLIKVGASASPNARRHDLSTTLNEPLELAWQSSPLENNSVAIEKTAHNLLAEFRKHGEWFDCSVEIAVKACKEALCGFQPKVNKYADIVRLTISGSDENAMLLDKLKQHMEKDNNRSYTRSKLFWLAIECLANAEGIK